jgi:hypothetical protein
MRSPTRREQTSDKDQQDRRWSSVLAEANQEHQPQDLWYRAAGVSLAWAGGLAGAAAVLATIVLLIADLFSAERLFTARNLSDWMFWAAALLMVLGLIVPSITDAEGSFGKVGEDKDEQEGESRLSRTLRRRLRRVYNPWRWRLWASAAFAFVLSVITGLLS